MGNDASLEQYPRRYCSVCGHVVRKEFLPGPGGRPSASCPRCRSLERHRFFALLVDILKPMLTDLDVLLDVAPSRQTTPILARLEPKIHTRIDLGADNRLVDVLGSLTELPLGDDSVDLLTCYHVLEHIPDDTAAMREIARVLGPNGMGILQVPYRPGTVTDEDPAAGPEERLRRFGQADHVRYYGDDFEDRLVDSGLSIQRITPVSLIGREMATWLHLNPVEMVWLVRPVANAAVPPREQPGATALTATFDALLRELADQHRMLLEARARAAGLRARIEDLEADNARLRRALAPALKARRAVLNAKDRLARRS